VLAEARTAPGMMSWKVCRFIWPYGHGHCHSPFLFVMGKIASRVTLPDD
jgi:hypothetical protein